MKTILKGLTIILTFLFLVGCAQVPADLNTEELTMEELQFETENSEVTRNGVVRFYKFDVLKSSATRANVYPWIHFNRNVSKIYQEITVINTATGQKYTNKVIRRTPTPAGAHWIAPITNIELYGLVPGRSNKLRCNSSGYVEVNGQRYYFNSGWHVKDVY